MSVSCFSGLPAYSWFQLLIRSMSCLFALYMADI